MITDSDPPTADPAPAPAGAGIGEPAELLATLGLAPEQARLDAENPFPFRVSAAFAGRIRPGDPADPLLRQVLPTRAEREPRPGFSEDPVGEQAGGLEDGLIRKYHGRALLIVTQACAIHCRYCFRRSFPYREAHAQGEKLRRALERIAADPSISEVILSGGDPLSLSDERLRALVGDIAAIPQVRSLRLHSRHPVALPERVTTRLCEMLTASQLRTVMVIHANHANELDAAVGRALNRLASQGITLLNQSVLLAGVNDAAPVLMDLSHRLLECGVLPYYLHLLDPVAGAAHFAVPLERARALHREVADQLPGYLVPRLVKEVAGAARKIAADELGDVA